MRLWPDPVPMFNYGKIYEPNFSIPDVGFGLKKNYGETRSYGVSFRTNSQGFRDYEFEIDKGDNYRIIALGDSYTLLGNLLSEQTYAKVLEQKLRNADIPAEVFNAGIGMTSPLQHLRRLEYQLLKYNPDVVIWQHFSNDISPNNGPETWNWYTLRDGTLQQRWAFIKRKIKTKFYFYKYASIAKKKLFERVKSETVESEYHEFDKDFVDYYIEAYEDEYKADFYRDVITKAVQLLHDNNIHAIFLYIPPLDAISTWENYRFDELDDKVVAWAKEAGFDEVVNAAEILKKYQFQEFVQEFYKDHHLNAFGAKVVADALFETVAR